MATPEVVFCGRCKTDVRYHFDRINHGKHLLISIFSLGLWLPIWMCVVFSPSKICDQCGQPIWNDQPAKPVAANRNAS